MTLRIARPVTCWGLIGLALATVGAAFAACATTPTTTPLGPSGNPSIAIAYPASTNPPACVEVPAGPTPRVPIGVVLDQVVLRPPGQCLGIVQCGHLVLHVLGTGVAADDAGVADAGPGEGELNNESASDVIDLDVLRLAARYATLTLTVDVIGDPILPDAGEAGVDAEAGIPDAGPLDPGPPLLDQAMSPVTAKVTIRTAMSCAADAG